MPTLMVMAGGTGGHIYPGIAVAEAMRERGWKIVWLGNPDGMEARLVPQQGYEMAWLNFSALRGKGLMRKLLLPVNLLRGFWQALRAIRKTRPDVVLGMGGYVTFPGGMMASLLARPLVVHEQNSVAGLSNKVLAGVATRVLSGFPEVMKSAEWVGNPVRADIEAIAPPEERFPGRTGPLRVLVVGGSLGAQALNEAVPKALALLAPEQRPIVVHQSGAKQLDALRAAYEAAGVEGELLPFIENMAQRYAEADLVICRSGALTVAELAAAGAASILVPFPHAVDDHQTGNARFLSERGAADLVPQPSLTPALLADKLGALDRERLLFMALAARKCARRKVASAVADVCERLVAARKSAAPKP
ncbi:undecaprenyldiphospho-muramoylpentapeptide beta-N-acetylglucosaminyltransferase [Uliginosibacterium sp. H3]|uniref:UDP-N-acetylglucosamine--N-acetylmuramyl-(pentapeptide) pyrophosphoryl-undecaprenol N-acetylglucosamine transferase n=1 Tax=Uliginosibacterium silvisoli TaxID=3114758 RepID=A0ABU6K300_9RHOO|nr:undecaprenyldiphospho-muramoylpentapeptide beta-N-acetylglucosaminyltransferase [Uliginosibacterium sp. H3]